MKPKKPSPIVGAQRDKLIVAVLMDDIVRSINTALRARKATVTIDYTHKDQMARLLVSMPGVEPNGWMISNQATRMCYRVKPAHPDLLAMTNDIMLRLATYDAQLILLAAKEHNQKPKARLQVQVGGSRSIVLTLGDAIKGTVTHDNEFLTPDGRLP